MMTEWWILTRLIISSPINYQSWWPSGVKLFNGSRLTATTVVIWELGWESVSITIRNRCCAQRLKPLYLELNGGLRNQSLPGLDGIGPDPGF